MKQAVALLTSRACDMVGILGLPPRPLPPSVHRQASVKAEGASTRQGACACERQRSMRWEPWAGQVSELCCRVLSLPLCRALLPCCSALATVSSVTDSHGHAVMRGAIRLRLTGEGLCRPFRPICNGAC